MIDKLKYLWRFLPFGDYSKDKSYRTEMLHSHSMVSQSALASTYYPDMILGYERDTHRKAVAEKVIEAMYEGWMPYDMEWWEGTYDDKHTLRGYGEAWNEDYHFWTKVKLASWTYPILKRNPSSEDVTFMAYTPKGLT